MTRLPRSLTTCCRGSDELPSRFWTSPRSVDTLNRERQLAVDFIAAAAGGPTFYLGRDMRMSHKGMGITKADYAALRRRTVGGIVKPSAFAVFILITRLSFVGCATGKSDGLAPFRILAT